MSLLEFVVLLAIILMILIAIYLERHRQKGPTPAMVVIQEGRFPGEGKDDAACPNCGRRFKHTIMFEEELVKCPFCGSEVD